MGLRNIEEHLGQWEQLVCCLVLFDSSVQLTRLIQSRRCLKVRSSAAPRIGLITARDTVDEDGYQQHCR